MDDTIEPVNLDRFRAAMAKREPIALFDYWLEKCGPQSALSRNRFEPMDIPKLLPYLFLLDYEASTDTLRYRLIGTFIGSILKGEIIGKTLEEGRKGPVVAHLNALFGTCARDSVPCVGFSQLEGESSSVFGYRRLALPMKSKDDGPVDMVVGCWTSERLERGTYASATASPTASGNETLHFIYRLAR